MSRSHPDPFPVSVITHPFHSLCPDHKTSGTLYGCCCRGCCCCATVGRSFVHVGDIGVELVKLHVT